METVRQIGAVALVLSLALFAAWRLRRVGLNGSAPTLALGRRSRTRRLEILERLALGPQHSLHLVRVGGNTLLIGASPSGCALLYRAAGGELGCEPGSREPGLQSPRGLP